MTDTDKAFGKTFFDHLYTNNDDFRITILESSRRWLWSAKRSTDGMRGTRPRGKSRRRKKTMRGEECRLVSLCGDRDGEAIMEDQKGGDGIHDYN